MMGIGEVLSRHVERNLQPAPLSERDRLIAKHDASLLRQDDQAPPKANGSSVKKLLNYDEVMLEWAAIQQRNTERNLLLRQQLSQPRPKVLAPEIKTPQPDAKPIDGKRSTETKSASVKLNRLDPSPLSNEQKKEIMDLMEVSGSSEKASAATGIPKKLVDHWFEESRRMITVEMAREMQEDGKSQAYIAAELDVACATIKSWMKWYDQNEPAIRKWENWYAAHASEKRRGK